MNLLKKLPRTATTIKRNLKRHSRPVLSSKFKAMPQARMKRESYIVLIHTMN
jgi:hypothetical protein